VRRPVTVAAESAERDERVASPPCSPLRASAGRATTAAGWSSAAC